MNHVERSTYPAALAALEAILRENGAEVTILYGPRASGKSRLLHDLLVTDQLAERFIPITLNVRKDLDRSRADVMISLAAGVVEATGLSGSFLNDFSPNRFHNEFLAQALQAIPPSKNLLFIFDNVDPTDRAQMS